jgi:aspartate-semialdehyde dehydrogenase
MMAETKKILDPKIKLTCTCVRVPVFIGHSESVNIEFEKPITADEARDILREAPGCLVIDKRETAATSRLTNRPARTRPTSRASARTTRSRTASTSGVVSDNLRKGAALNAIQIAELLVNVLRGLSSRRRNVAHLEGWIPSTGQRDNDKRLK